MKTVRSDAESHFKSVRKEIKEAAKKKHNAYQEMDERTARLRALRLAKEAVDKAAAEQEAAEAKTAKRATPKARATATKPSD